MIIFYVINIDYFFLVNFHLLTCACLILRKVIMFLVMHVPLESLSFFANALKCFHMLYYFLCIGVVMMKKIVKHQFYHNKSKSESVIKAILTHSLCLKWDWLGIDINLFGTGDYKLPTKGIIMVMGYVLLKSASCTLYSTTIQPWFTYSLNHSLAFLMGYKLTLQCLFCPLSSLFEVHNMVFHFLFSCRLLQSH